METRRTDRVALKFQSMLKESSVLFGRGSRQGVVDGYSYLRCCSRRSPAWLPSYLTIQCVQNFQRSSLRPPASRSRSKRLSIAADAVSIHRSAYIECIYFPAPVPQLSLVLCQQTCGRCWTGRLQNGANSDGNKFFPAILRAMDDETSGWHATFEPLQTVLEHRRIAVKLPFIEAFGKYGKGFWFAKGQILVQFPLATKFPRGHTLPSVVRCPDIWAPQTAS